MSLSFHVYIQPIVALGVEPDAVWFDDEVGGNGLTQGVKSLAQIVTGALFGKVPPEQGGRGLRIGIQELTRMGLTQAQLPALADLIQEGMITKEPESLIPKVKAFTAPLDTFHFCDE